MSHPTYTNHLIHETSPYLHQHAHNPVDWYPWGEEALKRAKEDDKPILLSIGYSACHWCHVMEHESFENPEIAQMMNEHFVNIKVDREERPDLDEIYMNAIQTMTGSGGWPMTVFLTTDLKPFYGGTYFPPDDRYGRTGFPRVLLAVAQYYKEHRADVEQQGEKLQARLSEIARIKSRSTAINPELLDHALSTMSANFDRVHGGFGTQPKFPPSMNLSFCLREYRRTGKQTALDMATLSLRKMAMGGMYDQLGGGFHRYSVDAEWLVPHFEKMLYDNALLLRTYLEGYQATNDPLFRRVVEEMAGYVIREMLQPGGGFYSTQDADSEGEEGKFFVWTPEEIMAALGGEKGALFCRYYGVEEGGNFEHGKSILHVPVSLEILAAHLKVDEAYFRDVIEEGRARLFALREQRVKPGRDEKVLTDWNGLMIGSLAQVYSVLENPAHRHAAEQSMRFILDKLYKDGRLLHVYKDGIARLNGYLDDYAFTVSALLDLYEATFNTEWLKKALELNETMIEQFWDDTDSGFFFTSADHEALIVRSKNPYDNAIPSGNSMGTLNLLRLAALTGREDFLLKAERTLILFHDFMEAAPSGFGQLFCALEWYLERPKEIAIIGTADAVATKALLRAIHQRFLPHKVFALHDPASGEETALDLIPLFTDRPQIDGKPTVYVCEHFLCRRPVTEVSELDEVLG